MPMRRQLIVCLIGLGLMPVLARGDEWHKNFAITAQPTVHVDTNDGKIQINTWDQSQVDARVITSGWDIGDSGVRITATQNGDEVDLVVRRPHDFGWSLGTRWVRIEVTVPRRVAELEARTGDGDIGLSFLSGNVRAHTGDGDVIGQNLDAARFDGSTGDGDIRLDGRFASLELRTGDGDVHVRAGQGSRIENPWTLRSGDGNIELTLPEGFKADLQAGTGDGSITLDFPLTMTGELSHSRASGELNGGGGILTLHTGDGSIHLRRE